MFWSDSLDCVRQVEGREYANDMSSPSRSPEIKRDLNIVLNDEYCRKRP